MFDKECSTEHTHPKQWEIELRVKLDLCWYLKANMYVWQILSTSWIGFFLKIFSLMRTECKLFKAIMKKNQSETIPVTNVVIYASR